MKKRYETPGVEKIFVMPECSLMEPSNWKVGDGDTIGIGEGGDEDPTGAKKHSFNDMYDLESENIPFE
ncbi:MAG: hypothetical protein ACOYJK_10080 [Prevotella sp.]|jgi:hypothetical protein